MASVFDVAKYFLNQSVPATDRSISHLKLQKLVYYAQAWNLAFHKKALFTDDVIEAWVHGPVCPKLYHQYRHHGYDDINEKSPIILVDTSEIELMGAVWQSYGAFTGKYLEQLTHQEEPWIKARQGLKPYDYGTKVIQNEDMQNYYSERLTRST